MAREKINKKLKLLLLISIFLSFSYFITRGINLPYVGYNAWNFNTYSLIAKNYNTFGYLKTKLAPIVSVSENLPDKPKYYLHHPQLLPVIESFLFKLFGEHFWVGRLVVIIFSLGSMILIYRIGSLLKGEVYGLFALAIAGLIPASSVFGRMIDMEPLVLFFSLTIVYSLLQYMKSKKTVYLVVVFASISLGVLSDWPMTYFTLSLLPFLIYKKSLKLGLAMVTWSFVVEAAFLSYVYFLMSGFGDMISAVLTRSTGALLSLQFWPFFWLATLFVRFLLYFNPLFILFSTLYLGSIVVQIVKKKYTNENLIQLSLFSLGFFYVTLFPEGSYGHAYWIYYFIPFVALSSAEYFSMLLSRKRYFVLIIILAFSLIFLWKVNDWKVKEVKANVFRYILAEKVNIYLKPYEQIIINGNGVIDPDLLSYKFLHHVQIVNVDSLPGHQTKTLVYSCLDACSLSDNVLNSLVRNYKNTSVRVPEAQAYIIVLSQKQEKPSIVIPEESYPAVRKKIKTNSKDSMVQKIYRTVKDFLQAPQL